VDAAERDFGEHRPGDVLSHAFVLSNPTDGPITIVDAVSSCTCTVLDDAGIPPDTTIAPRGTLTVPVTLKTAGRHDQVAGRVTITYQIRRQPEDTARELSLVLRVRAMILSEYRVTPQALDFGNVDGFLPSPRTQTLVVTSLFEHPITVEQVYTSSDFLRARLLPAQGRDAQFPIEVGLDTSRFVKTRRFDGAVVITTSSDQRPTTIVKVRGIYVAPASVSPDAVIVDSREAGFVERELIVTTSLPSQIRSVNVHDDTLTAAFDSSSPAATEHRLQLTIATEEDLNSQIDIEVSLLRDGGQSPVLTLSVPVHRFSRKRGG